MTNIERAFKDGFLSAGLGVKLRAEMEIIYLDQFVPSKIRRPKPHEACHFNELYRALKQVASAGIAIAPFSDCHIAESHKISDGGHREWLANFWFEVGNGMRYISSLGIQQQQIESLIDRTPIRFWPNRAVMKSPLRFDQYLETHRDDRNREIRSTYREVVSYWKTLTRKEIDKKIRHVELHAISKMIVSMFDRWLKGQVPTLHDFNSRYGLLLNIVQEKLRKADGNQISLDEPLAWMSQNLVNVPSLHLEACCLEAIAEQYAKEASGSVENSQLDHDAYDFEAFSYFLPYSSAGIFDNKATPKFQSACRKSGIVVPKFYCEREIEAFVSSLNNLRATESVEPSKETAGHLFCILVIPIRGNPLVKRFPIGSSGGINREILPNGGIKQWQAHDDYSKSLMYLKATFVEFPDETEALLPAQVLIAYKGAIRCSDRIEFGSWEIDEQLAGRISGLV